MALLLGASNIGSLEASRMGRRRANNVGGRETFKFYLPSFRP